ncbi:MAG TPA: TetR/AcrR family transcriptional regulator [Thermoleophilaceae bacterium]|nr:TetR/AcrR family transcriptional regulator [Thermoleophilaceae bacterium]
MASRKYEQRLRAESAEETRRRILDAVYARMRAAPARPISVDAVARDARVARSTVYAVFGSRAGLFDALAQEVADRGGYDALLEAVRDPDVRVTLSKGFRASVGMYAADRDVFRVLFSMAELDAEAVGGAVGRIDDERRAGMARLARRLGRASLLRDGVSVERAAHVLWVLASFDAFDLLYSGRGLDADAVSDVLLEMAAGALLAPGALE